MLICVGGLPGSGRKDFAHRIAEKSGFYAFDLESNMRTLLLRREYQRGEETLSDALRLRMFQHVARNFAHVSETFRNVIVDEPFHRIVPREFLFAEGARYFKRVAVVWVEETEAHIEERILRVREKNPRLTPVTARTIIETMERDFEPFVTPPIFAYNVVNNPLVVDNVVRALAR